MTRFLSTSLQAREPTFRLRLKQLEQSRGYPCADIRLTSSIAQAVRLKTAALTLDPTDTTEKELYLALQSRLLKDEQSLIKTLRTRAAKYISLEADPMAGLSHALKEVMHDTETFSAKPFVIKGILKKQPPKRTMKLLGYRSVDSLLRHEVPALILAAATYHESKSWWDGYRNRYRQLQSQDFEQKRLTILYPSSQRWDTFAVKTVHSFRNNIIAFPELGALIVLPLPVEIPGGTITAATLMAIQSTQELLAAGTYLQMCQLRSDFGVHVQRISRELRGAEAQVLGDAVPWQLIHRSLATFAHELDETIFEPHLNVHEIRWHSLSRTLQLIAPELHFWHGAEHVASLNGTQPISFHPLDVALNLCNRIPYEKRTAHYFRQSLWHELLLRYLHPADLEQAVLTLFQPQLAPAFAETT